MIAFNLHPPENPHSDIGLMLRTQQGSAIAFDELVSRHWPRTVGLIVSMTGDPDGAEDLAQEVFFRVYRASGSYVPTAKFSTWLGLITKHVVFNDHRRRSRSIEPTRWEPNRLRPSGTAPAPHRLISRELGPAESALQQERSEGVRCGLGKLNRREQHAIELFHFQGMTYDEIANELSSSPNAVKSLLARSRSKLKSILALSPTFTEPL